MFISIKLTIFMKEIEKRKNCIISELRNFVHEFERNELILEDVFRYVSTILIDSGMDSRDVVSILEDMPYDEVEDIILGIKVNEGW